MNLRTRPARVFAYVAALAIVVACVALLRALPIITTVSAAPVLLLAVLIIARQWGTGPGLLASASAAAGFSYYFLVPVGKNRLEDPNDWAAFFTFTLTAIIVGELSARAERRHLEAQAGRREIERLYQELQAAFDRASEAEAARRNEQLKATLLDALTHNLRTPLTAIKASVTALMGAMSSEAKREAGLSSEGRRELLQIIDEESDRLNRFIEGLSAVDASDPGQRMTAAAARIEDVVRAAIARAHTLTRDHRIHVTLGDALPSLAVDGPSIIEVLYILLDNASKYAPPGTAIALEASRDASHARITIADEGPGIPVDAREKVFERFFRMPGREPSDTRRPRGVGLGLPIARRLVEAQSGRMWIETPASGRGTAVVISLPLRAAAPAREPAVATAIPA
jgi:K+-sensing histidine kinase KdpD